MATTKLKTSSFERIENKKRKLLAFLELIQTTNNQPQNHKKPGKRYLKKKKALEEFKDEMHQKYQDVVNEHEPPAKFRRIDQSDVPNSELPTQQNVIVAETKLSSTPSISALKNELKQYVKTAKPPVIAIKEHSKYLLIENPFKNPGSKNKPAFKETANALCVKDVQDLILYSLLDSKSLTKPIWINAGNLRSVETVNLIVVDNVSLEDVYEHRSLFTNCCGHFYFAEMMALAVMESFPTELACAIISPHQENTKSEPATKTTLLLNPMQMLLENYPIPCMVTDGSQYVFTKEGYKPVTNESPMFGLDCEMCVTKTDQSALTRISVVDESHKVLYDTLVQPPSKIIDYLTRYSGITKEMMTGVTTTLADVQKEIQTNLPSNAILVGQSLHFDLKAIKMVHPYVIDTALIYNLRGNRRHKSSLKDLSAVFLNESIQNAGAAGHDSIEDSVSALKLVQLKLKNDLNFGDVVNGYRLNTAPYIESDKEIPNEGFFDKLIRFEKSCSIVGQSEIVKSYLTSLGNIKPVKRVHRAEIDEIKIASILPELLQSRLTISHMTAGLPFRESLPKVDSCVARIFEKRSRSNLTVVVFTGIKSDGKNSMGLVIPMV